MIKRFVLSLQVVLTHLLPSLLKKGTEKKNLLKKLLLSQLHLKKKGIKTTTLYLERFFPKEAMFWKPLNEKVI